MTLEDIGPDDWRHCAALGVEESQRPFVAPVPYYLASCAYDEGPWRPTAVRVADAVVGFVMWGVDSTDGGHWTGGLIIDRPYQRRGYGRAAVLELLERAWSKLDGSWWPSGRVESAARTRRAEGGGRDLRCLEG
jgi:diamine N-acetyltransferase